jgi:TnpA family transposase
MPFRESFFVSTSFFFTRENIMRASNKRLTLFSKAEQFALYGFPDFNEIQRYEYFILTEQELKLIFSRPNISTQVYCSLQIGYFKAKQLFFKFSWEDVPVEDITFIIKSYFPNQTLPNQPIIDYEHYTQRKQIAQLFGYQLWSNHHTNLLYDRTTQIVRRDANPKFVLAELIQFFKEQKIIRPAYTTFQTIMSQVMNAERDRLNIIVLSVLNEEHIALLKQLMTCENIFSDLTILKRDAKDFTYRVIMNELLKMDQIKPLYLLMKSILPSLNISQQNLRYYASLTQYYTIYKLQQFKPTQSYLYILCYTWQRYQQLMDNIVEAFHYHSKHFDEKTKEMASERFKEQARRQQNEFSTIGRLLQLYVDEKINDDVQFGKVRDHYAFSIMPKDRISQTVTQFLQKNQTEFALRWQAVDQQETRFKKYLRPLFLHLTLESPITHDYWKEAIYQLKQVLTQKHSIRHIACKTSFIQTIPKKLKPQLLQFSKDHAIQLQMGRYEFWLYRQINRRLKSGTLYLEDSFNHRCFAHELVPITEKERVLQQLDLPCLHIPIQQQLHILFQDLQQWWHTFDTKLKQEKLPHLQYDKTTKSILWKKPHIDDEDEEIQNNFYEQLPHIDIADVLRFVNKHCHFLSALTPLQSRYTKQEVNDDTLIASIASKAMNHRDLKMSEVSDVPYYSLNYTSQQRLRPTTLREANDIISQAIAKMRIFPYYSLDLMALIGAVDGQKYELEHPTMKARYSRKYFGKGKGVVAYTLLLNHIPLQSLVIGANEHESYYLFDILYHNTSNIVPEAVSGDMHSINKANFAILHCFKCDFIPRFSDLYAQLKHLYYTKNLSQCQNYWVKPVGVIDDNLITDEWSNIERIIITLALKETTQSTIIKKLCTYRQNRTFKALFEFDKLIRSIYTLKYLCNFELQRQVHRSQNRVEAYHQLRAAIAQVCGKKQLFGRTDLEVEISNQCGRLFANAMIFYNSFLLSQLAKRYEQNNDDKALKKLKKISPIAWQHIHLSGYYKFLTGKHPVDIDEIIKNLIV